MFSFFIGLGIALFIAIAGFGGFLFKLSNANQRDMAARKRNLENIPADSAAKETAAGDLNNALSKPDFSAGTF